MQRTEPTDTTPIAIGVRAHPLRDVYHLLLRSRWPVTLSAIALSFLALNLLFATLFTLSGGIANAEAGSFRDAFFFSIQTFATIGYGAMHPESGLANSIVVVESVVALFTTAITTGLVFTKFSVSSARLVFSNVAVIAPMNGVPTLMLRIGNDRGDRIYDTVVRIALTRTEAPAEGGKFYRMIDLRLVRERAPALTRSFSIMHAIDESSPLFGATAESLAKSEAELLVSVGGTDEVTLQPVHAARNYTDREILFGHRFVDILSERADGRLVIDVTKFHDVEEIRGEG